MKKYPYIVAAACVLVGALGFSSIYVNQQAEQEQQLAQEQQVLERTQGLQEFASNSQGDAEKGIANDQERENPENRELPLEDYPEDVALEIEDEEVKEEEADAQVGTITEEAIHFDLKGDRMWPVEGTVLLDYSMDSTIFFPTLQQYEYNPAMVFAADVNSKVYFVARGKITNIVTDVETGCTVTQDLGDGYTAIYGQLKELNFEVGDMVEAGQVVGYVSEPTKYYALEGSNVYFQLLKDGIPVDPEEILP